MRTLTMSLRPKGPAKFLVELVVAELPAMGQTKAASFKDTKQLTSRKHTLRAVTMLFQAMLCCTPPVCETSIQARRRRRV